MMVVRIEEVEYRIDPCNLTANHFINHERIKDEIEIDLGEITM